MQNIQSEKLRKLINILNDSADWDNESVIDLVKKMKIEEEDVRKYQLYQHEPQYSYGRNEIYVNERFRIYLMSWDSGDATAIHDHGSTGWGCVQFIGDATHRSYKVEDDSLQLVDSGAIPKGTLVPVAGNFIHLMSNAGVESVCTLHIYGRNTPNPENEVAVIYQPELGRTVTTSGTAYLNMDESEIVTKAKLPVMSQADYQDYIQLITPFYKRIGKEEVLLESPFAQIK